MAGTTIQGTDGGSTFPAGYNAKFQSWRATIEGRVYNTTGFGDKGWITGEIINARIIGDAIGVITVDTPVPAAVMAATLGVASMKGEIVLTAKTGFTWTFDALITAVALDRAEEGPASSVYRISYESTGPVVQAWA